MWQGLNKTALFYAIENNKDISIIKLLIEKGANINARSNDGMTPLMYASKLSLGNDLVVLLIKNGAKITDIDTENHKISLSIRALIEEAKAAEEAMPEDYIPDEEKEEAAE